MSYVDKIMCSTHRLAQFKLLLPHLLTVSPFFNWVTFLRLILLLCIPNTLRPNVSGVVGRFRYFTDTYTHRSLKHIMTFFKCSLNAICYNSKYIMKFSIDFSILCLFDSYLWLFNSTRSSQVSLNGFQLLSKLKN